MKICYRYLFIAIICLFSAALTPFDILSLIYVFYPPVICQDFNKDYLHGTGAYDAYLKETVCDGFGGSRIDYGTVIDKATSKIYPIFEYDGDADPVWKWLGPDKLEVTASKTDYDPHLVNQVGPVEIDYIVRDKSARTSP